MVMAFVPMAVTERFTSSGQRNLISIEASLANPAAEAFFTEVHFEPDPTNGLTEVPKADLPERTLIPQRPSLPQPTAIPAEQPQRPTVEIQQLATVRLPAEQDLPTVPDSKPMRRRRAMTSQFSPAATNAPPKEQLTGLSDHVSADFTSNPPPKYPSDAIRRRIEGTVLVRMRVDVTGRVRSAEIVRSSGHASLDRAAVEAVERWKGQPARRFGRAVASEEVLPIRFRL